MTRSEHCTIVTAIFATTLSALTLSLSGPISISFADDKNSERARYVQPDESPNLRFTPVNLSNGSKLTLISPKRWSDTANNVVTVLNSTHEEFTEIFNEIPAFSTSIRLMDEDEFFKLTGAPKWTNAMFFKGQIVIPLSATQPVDAENLARSIKHEYTHAILSALSSGQLPGWIDEGLAQWFEGEENPGLREALRSWLKTNEPVPLALLQGGFTKLRADMVPAAYAQSLLATRALVDRNGMDAVAKYFFMLREGVDKESAFTTAFSMTTEEFENHLSRALKVWAAKLEKK